METRQFGWEINSPTLDASEKHTWADQLPFLQGRKVLDPIHGFISFEHDIWSFIDTIQFQRMRDLKQMGTSTNVFPGATHTRFEHCIGTGHVANVLVKRLLEQQPNLSESDDDKRRLAQCVTLGGLCHDLGHGPYSHLFEHVLQRINPVLDWKHEEASEMMLDNLVDQNHIDIEPENVKLIKRLISGEALAADPKWIFDIISNKRNSIDVDKFDYIWRDSYYVGIKETSFDFRPLLNESLVIDDEICYPMKVGFQIYNLFQSRYKLFKMVYCHRVTQGIDEMIIDALAAANCEFNFDTQKSTKPSLKKSREILQRIRTRKLYKFVGEVAMGDASANLPGKDVMVEHIISCKDKSSSLSTDDIFIQMTMYNYALKDKNPVDYVHFYNKATPWKMTTMKPEEVSLMLPSKFIERFYRVYVKDTEKMEDAKKAFKKYCSSHLRREASVVEGTPRAVDVLSMMGKRSNGKLSIRRSDMESGGESNANSNIHSNINSQKNDDSNFITGNK